MGKLLTKYRGFTPALIRSRADIPQLASMIVSGDNVDCSNILMSHVRSVIGSANSDLYALCRHNNVNPWSGFGPTVRSVNSQVLVNSKPAIARLGDFAGYNHDAVTPGWFSDVPSGDIWVSVYGNAQFGADVYVGEVKWHELGIVGVVHAIYDDTNNIVAWVGRNFETDAVQDDVTGLYAYVNNVSIEKTYTGKIWLVNSIEDFDGSQIVCRLPNTSDYSRTVKILPFTQAVPDAPGDFTLSVGFSNTPTNGWVRFQNLQSPNSYDEVRVYASIYGFQEGAEIGSRILLATYYSWIYDFIESGEGRPNGDWYIPQYGYLCIITVEVVNY